MSNKKALGMRWYITLLAVFIGLGIILFFKVLFPAPIVGEFPVMLQKNLEETNKVNTVLESIMKQISRNSISNISSDVFQLSNCKNYINYKLLNSENEICFNKNLEGDFKAIFDKKYIEFQSKKFEDFNLDFSNIIYDFSIKNENDKFFLIGNTNTNLEILIIPSNKKGKQVGKIFVKPNFIIPINYDFQEYEKLAKAIDISTSICKGEDCVNDILSKEGFEIQACGKDDGEKSFYNFLEYLDSCYDSEGKNCICLDKPEVGSFNIRQSGNNAKITGNINKKEFPAIELESIKLANDRVVLDKGDLLYKNEEGKISVIKESGIDGKTKCELKAKTKFRFCVKSNKNQYYAYDEDAQKIAFKDLVYKFALQFSK